MKESFLYVENYTWPLVPEFEILKFGNRLI